jgi:hypothetical protein
MPSSKISALPVAGALTGSEAVPLVQGGQTRKAVLSAIVSMVVSQLGTASTHDVEEFLLSASRGSANGVAALDGAGKIPASQIPAMAISDIFVVADEAGQLALEAERGDVAVRTDESKTYMHNGGTSGTMTDWTFLPTPGLTGAVINPMDEAGDIIVGSGGGSPVRMGMGAALSALRVNALGSGLEYVVLPKGADGAIQFRDGDDFASDSDLSFDPVAKLLSIRSMTLLGRLVTAATTAGGANVSVPAGTVPTAPEDGDVWMTAAGLFYRCEGVTFGPLGAGDGPDAGAAAGVEGAVQISVSGVLGSDAGFTYNTATDTLFVRNLSPQELLQVAASVAGAARLNMAPGVAPTAPANGDVWMTADGLYCRAGGATLGPFSAKTVAAGAEGRVQLAGAAFAFASDADLTYDAATKTLKTGNVTLKAGESVVQFGDGAAARWQVLVADDAPAHIKVIRLDDDGLPTGDALAIDRATGEVTLEGALTVGGAVTVAGEATFQDSVAMEGSLDVAGPLVAAGRVVGGADHNAGGSSTPTFDAALGDYHTLELTADLLGMVVTNPVEGQPLRIRVKQDATGGWLAPGPVGAKLSGSVGLLPNQASMLTLHYNLADTRLEGEWVAFPV